MRTLHFIGLVLLTICFVAGVGASLVVAFDGLLDLPFEFPPMRRTVAAVGGASILGFYFVLMNRMMNP